MLLERSDFFQDFDTMGWLVIASKRQVKLGGVFKMHFLLEDPLPIKMFHSFLAINIWGLVANIFLFLKSCCKSLAFGFDLNF